MIYLSTQTPEYFNDICDVIRLFFGATSIELCINMETAQLLLAEDIFMRHTFSDKADRLWESTAQLITSDGKRADYTFTFQPPQEMDALMRKRYMKRCTKIACFRMLAQFTGRKMPWGSLTGIRPARLMRDLSAEGMGLDAARAAMTGLFDCSQEKADLVYETVKNQEPIIATQKQGDLDIYIGIPFCVSRCLYCSFTSYAISRKWEETQAYIQTLLTEMQQVADVLPSGRQVRSIYIGGGTPTALNLAELEQLLDAVSTLFIHDGMEYTIEAGRPDTLDNGKLALMKDHGVNRISINPQSMNDKTLMAIGRCHSVEQTNRAFESARETGFDCINMDIIAGLPGENTDDFNHTLQWIQKLNPDNLTVHTLAVKRASRLHEEAGKHALPGLNEVEAMVDASYKCAKAMGMAPYYLYRQKYMTGNLENVGYALPQKECVYNIDIMEESVDILAFGAGAISKRIFPKGRIERLPNPKDLKYYLSGINEHIEKKIRFVNTLK